MFLRTPSPEEWSFDRLPEYRRKYLEREMSFEEICDRILDAAKIVSVRPEPYATGRTAEEKEAYQLVARISVSPENCDLFFNSRDGLRGKYWQSPDAGILATRLFIALCRALILMSANAQKILSSIHSERSLDGISAKVWPYERNEAGEIDFGLERAPSIFVERWSNEQSHAPNGPLWRWSPCDRDLEVKGALINGSTEFIPPDKKERSNRIHKFGFT